jgi:hypothetical protein
VLALGLLSALRASTPTSERYTVKIIAEAKVEFLVLIDGEAGIEIVTWGSVHFLDVRVLFGCLRKLLPFTHFLLTSVRFG